MKIIFLLLLVFLTLACTASVNTPPEPEKPTKIIFLIGDQPSVFNRFHEIGLQQTSSAIEKVTDSAASVTALVLIPPKPAFRILSNCWPP